MALSLLIFVALPTALAIPVTVPPQSSSGAPLLPGSFQQFLNTHVTTPPPANIDDGGAIGFHVQLGHNSTVSPGQILQLSNYFGVKRGLHATGPLAFEAYNGSYCPPVRGYYFVGATLHLNSSLNHDPTKNGTTPLVTVSVCLFGFCYNERVASLDSFSSTTGLHTVSVTGLLSLTDNDRLVVQVKTNSVTTAKVLKHSSFMGFLWGRSRS